MTWGDVVTVKKKKWNTAQNLRITELCEVYEYGGYVCGAYFWGTPYPQQ